jgi:elongator complex protein 3
MATETMTIQERQRKPKDSNLLPESERFIRCCADIANSLIQEFESQQDPTKPKKDLNLNSLRSKMSKKHRLSNIPPLTAIIAAIPEHFKKYILPRLIAKPVRSASGIAVVVSSSSQLSPSKEILIMDRQSCVSLIGAHI